MKHTLQNTEVQQACYHCGQPVGPQPLQVHEKVFCCLGCKTVFQLLDKHGLCQYYQLQQSPGVNQRLPIRPHKFDFLDLKEVQDKLLQFTDAEQAQVCLYLPQIHCSSCLWLLEHLHTMDAGIISSRVSFATKEATIRYNHTKTSLRDIAETLTSIGYEPHFSLQQMHQKPALGYNRRQIIKLGVTAFCFSNIMLLSFPDYLGLHPATEGSYLSMAFRYLSLVLSLPVLFYGAADFFTSGFKALQQRFLNIDAPIALAIAITFIRSVVDIVSNTGPGFLDSMSGIVLFMLIGRWLQSRTQQSLQFNRDYTSYFPVSVHRLENEEEIPIALPALKVGDCIRIHAQEVIPADGILAKGTAAVDYSFVTGESLPVHAGIGELVYAGGRQTGGVIDLVLVKEVSTSYLTSLWNKASMQQQPEDDKSWTHRVSRYFTMVLFTLTAAAAGFWYVQDAAKVWTVVTAALLVACPCTLLLSNTFTLGHIMAVLDKAGFYVRSSAVLEQMHSLTHIVFDKTGTLTIGQAQDIQYQGSLLSAEHKTMLAVLAAQSNHPLSRALAYYFKSTVQPQPTNGLQLVVPKEHAGQGVEGWVMDHHIKIGSPAFAWGHPLPLQQTVVAVSIDDGTRGLFIFRNKYRRGLLGMLRRLQKRYSLAVLSGDSESEKAVLQQALGRQVPLHFKCSPVQKLEYIEHLQGQGNKVMMVGDGLNDAGALKASIIGVAVAEDVHQFSPGCDAIIQAKSLDKLHRLLKMASAGRGIIYTSFAISILYNIVGLSFAFSGQLSAMVAAILMPASSISIILFSWLASKVVAKVLKL
ncbi:MAG TPA: heavy metal translocating P-type ATPase metal-binding domain-containing protein [Phnomibacter sp.]|nr:heavy metal translocating P-type ATPase metal-binding domain-containing protein [Phnomibacter sp.]